MNDEQIERVAKALCAETCAYTGEPPCYAVEGDWPNPECDEPGCHTLAARAIAAMQPDAQTIRNAALREAAELAKAARSMGGQWETAAATIETAIRGLIKESPDD